MAAPWHKKNNSTKPSKLNGITVQSSVYGKAIARGWGTYRVAANLLWYGDFKAIEHNQKAGGKGGGSVTNTTYSYTASVIMAIGAGPISSITAVYKDQSILVQDPSKGTPLQQAGLSLMTGTIGQAPWDYLTTNHPDEAIGYSGICYVYAADYDLGTGGTLSNHSFEVSSVTHEGTSLDANPADILPDFIQSVPFWASGLINTTTLTDYGNYCRAAKLLLSPVLDDSRQASAFIEEILQASNSEVVSSDGQLKFIPYGDTQITGNGTTWTPNLTPIYDLTDDDFIPPSQGEDPVEVSITRAADAYNYIQLEYLDRSHQYNTAIVPGQDQASIDQFGKRQNQSAYQLHSICDSAVANSVAQLIVQRTSNARARYRFRLPANYGLLEPMDLVTLTTGDMDHVLVRLVDVDEVTGDGDIPDEIEVEAEQMLVGTSQAADYSRQETTGYQADPDVDPGTIGDFALICPPRTLTNGDYEVWVGAAGNSDNWGGAEVWASLDDVNYEYVGKIDARARIGYASALPVGTDPDTTHTVNVDLSSSGGTLLDGTQADVDNAITLCLVNSELIAYRDSTLVAPFDYNLSYLRRGLYGTTIASHSASAPFIRMDDTLAKVPYAAEQVGSTFYIKLLSFNYLGRATKALDEVAAHSIVLNPGAAPVVDIISQDTKNVAGRPSTQVLTEIDLALAKAATLEAEVLILNGEIDTALAAVDDALAKVTALLGITETAGAALIKQSLSHLDLRDIANDWTALDGERITVPVAYGKRVDSLLGEITEDGSALILHRDTVWVSDTQSWASYETQVQTNFDNNLALINSNYTTLTTADTAIAASVTTLATTVNGNTASINTLSIAQSTDHNTFTSQISTLNSNYGSLSSTVSSNFSTLTSQDTAIANAVLGTSSTLNGTTTQVSLTQTALATATGQLYGSLTLKTNANGAIASMQLLSSSGATNLGAVVFDVSNFLIKSSSNPNIAPFSYDATSGTLFLDTITVRRANIQTAAIDTLQINGGAVSGTSAFENPTPQSLSGTGGSTATPLTFGYTASGGSVQVIFYCEIGATTSADAGVVVTLKCDGTVIGAGGINCPGLWGNMGVGIPVMHTPSSGSHTYTVTYTVPSGGGSSGPMMIQRTYASVTELKR